MIDAYDLVGPNVAEALVVGIKGHDLVGPNVAEALVVGIKGQIGHA